MQDAFYYYLREGASCYTSGMKFTPAQAIEQIHLTGGKAILAHPHFFKQRFVRDKLLAFPFDGIECYYGTLDKSLSSPG